MEIIKIKTNGQSANKCHDFLILNGINPIYFSSDERRDLFGNITELSTEFELAIKAEDLAKAKEVLDDFLLLENEV